MIDSQLEERLSELPLYIYAEIDPKQLDFQERVRWICEHECQMFGKTWSCPPYVGTVEQCREKCLSYSHCLMISTVAEVPDISDIQLTLETRGPHEEITDEVGKILRELGYNPFILSTESCAICAECACKDGKPCRFPEKMHPCVESHGINIIPVLEENGLEFQYGSNVVTWVSLLFYGL